MTIKNTDNTWPIWSIAEKIDGPNNYWEIQKNGIKITSASSKLSAEAILSDLQDTYVGTLDFLEAYKARRINRTNGVLRSESFLRRFREENPAKAQVIAEDIEANIAAASEVAGLPPGALERIIRWLRGESKY